MQKHQETGLVRAQRCLMHDTSGSVQNEWRVHSIVRGVFLTRPGHISGIGFIISRIYVCVCVCGKSREKSGLFSLHAQVTKWALEREGS